MSRMVFLRMTAQIAIETRDWQQGTYLYTLSANGNAVANQKFVLIK